MHKLIASAYKEALLLVRDIGGITILFVMPLVLLITITLIQNSSFNTISDAKILVLVVDHDGGNVSERIIKGLVSSNSFEVVNISTEAEAKNSVFKGDYQLAIVIPENLSLILHDKVNNTVSGILDSFGVEDETHMPSQNDDNFLEVRLYFDPVTQSTFKSSVKNGIDKMIFQIQSQSIYEAFEEQLGEGDNEMNFETDSFISFKEIVPTVDNKQITLNSAQHNVPAWTLFAIFFIIVPLSINLVKEKTQGTSVRLRTNPVSYMTSLGGKTIVYLSVCLVQFTLMMLVGVYLFPQIGLPALDVSDRIILLFVVATFSGFAAVGLGMLLGTIAKTQEQSAPFGATLVVILAALGGVWVPVFVMPEFMQILSNISPMNWGLNAFYDVFLRNSSLMDIVPEISKLFLFFIITTYISIAYNKRKNAV